MLLVIVGVKKTPVNQEYLVQSASINRIFADCSSNTHIPSLICLQKQTRIVREEVFMKKSIVCIVLFLVVAGSSFLAAQESKLKLQARTKLNLVTVYPDDDSLNSGISLPGDDEFGVSWDMGTAGVYLALKGSLPDGTVKLYDYYGWMKFGELKLSAGEWSHRKVSTLGKDGSSFGGLWDLEYGALALNDEEEGFIEPVTESDNITPWKTELAADYSFGTVAVSVATGSGSADAYNIADQFGARVRATVSDNAMITATGIMTGKDLATLGLFAELSPIGGLTAVVGYSGYHDLETSENSKNAIELRAMYRMELISLVSHNNVTFGDDEMILYNMVNLAYSVSDLLRPAILVANTNTSGDAAAIIGNIVTVRPGLTLSPRKGATIDAGVRFEYFTPEEGDSMTRISVPVVFRVKL